MHCRRCQSPRLIPLEKKLQGDNDVFRCQECGYIFSPGASPVTESRSRTTAVQSGYPAQS